MPKVPTFLQSQIYQMPDIIITQKKQQIPSQVRLPNVKQSEMAQKRLLIPLVPND